MTHDQDIHEALEALRTYINNITYEGDTLALDIALSRIEKFIYHIRVPIYEEWKARRAAKPPVKKHTLNITKAELDAILNRFEVPSIFKE